MKKIILILPLFISQICFGQNFDEILPKSYLKISEAKGDLDKDGIDEIVYVYNTDKEINDLGFERELYICKIIDGKRKLWKKNNSILWNSKEGGFFSENIMTIEILKNTLILKQTHSSNSKHSITYKNIFRFQNNDWYLIGSNCTDETICSFKFVYEINFSTNNVNFSEEYSNCEDIENYTQKNYYKIFKHNFKEIPKMDGFRAGINKFKIPKIKKYVYY